MRVCCAALCTSRPFQPLLCTLCFLLSPRSRFWQAVHVISFTFWRRRPWRSRRALACHAAWGVMAVPPLRGRRSGIHFAPVCIVFTFQEHLCLPEWPPTGCAGTAQIPLRRHLFMGPRGQMRECTGAAKAPTWKNSTLGNRLGLQD
jgi:hypothetical protein